MRGPIATSLFVIIFSISLGASFVTAYVWNGWQSEHRAIEAYARDLEQMQERIPKAMAGGFSSKSSAQDELETIWRLGLGAAEETFVHRSRVDLGLGRRISTYLDAEQFVLTARWSPETFSAYARTAIGLCLNALRDIAFSDFFLPFVKLHMIFFGNIFMAAAFFSALIQVGLRLSAPQKP